jgi:hypothetical protein
VLLTRSPLSPAPKSWFSLDLHVLSAPPAFVLSQDQTLREDRFALSHSARCKLIQDELVLKVIPISGSGSASKAGAAVPVGIASDASGHDGLIPHAAVGIASDASGREVST